MHEQTYLYIIYVILYYIILYYIIYIYKYMCNMYIHTYIHTCRTGELRIKCIMASREGPKALPWKELGVYPGRQSAKARVAPEA